MNSYNETISFISNIEESLRDRITDLISESLETGDIEKLKSEEKALTKAINHLAKATDQLSRITRSQ